MRCRQPRNTLQNDTEKRRGCVKRDSLSDVVFWMVERKKG